MKREQLNRYRKQLQAMLDRVQKTAAELEEQVRAPVGGEAGGGLSNTPLHLGDMGSEAYAQELGATLLQNETYLRDEVIQALDRIDRGTYGRCSHCGEDIIPARLEVLPYTRSCTSCAAKFQEGRAVNLNDGRPAEWLGEPGHEGMTQTGSPPRVVGRDVGSATDDVYAVGTPGGGSASGGLAGTNVGRGTPDTAHLEKAMGSGMDDEPVASSEEDQPEAYSGPAGGAVGGTPANKRARGGRSSKTPQAKAQKKGTKKRPKK